MQSTLDEATRAHLSDTVHIWATFKSTEGDISYCTRCGKRPDQVTSEVASEGASSKLLPCKGFVG